MIMARDMSGLGFIDPVSITGYASGAAAQLGIASKVKSLVSSIFGGDGGPSKSDVQAAELHALAAKQRRRRRVITIFAVAGAAVAVSAVVYKSRSRQTPSSAR